MDALNITQFLKEMEKAKSCNENSWHNQEIPQTKKLMRFISSKDIPNISSDEILGMLSAVAPTCKAMHPHSEMWTSEERRSNCLYKLLRDMPSSTKRRLF